MSFSSKKHVKYLYPSVAAVVFLQVDLALQDLLGHAQGFGGSLGFQLDTQGPGDCFGFQHDIQGPGASLGFKHNTLLEAFSRCWIERDRQTKCLHAPKDKTKLVFYRYCTSKSSCKA